MELMDIRHVNEDLYLVDGGIDRAILAGNHVHLQTVLFRAGIVEKIGGIDVTLRSAEDFEFFWRAAVLGAQYAYLNRLLIERHKYESSVTACTIDAAVQKLGALKACHRTCETAQRPDLLTHIRAAEHRTWRKLIRAYSDKGERAKIWWAFRKSLRCGFSPRTSAFFVIGMGGPQVMSFAIKLRARSLRPSVNG